MIQSRASITVRYAETDMMGIVYHANYLPWFEVARTQLLREQGFPYKQLELDGYRIPVLEVSAKYLRPALYDDTLPLSPRFGKNRCCEFASTTKCFVARSGSRLVRPPTHFATSEVNRRDRRRCSPRA